MSDNSGMKHGANNLIDEEGYEGVSWNKIKSHGSLSRRETSEELG